MSVMTQDLSNDLSKALLPEPGEKIDPHELARRDQKMHLPRRFYKDTGVEADGDLFALTLDGRRARTPARNALAVAREPVAQALAAEWAAQGEFVDPGEMPLTRLVNAALDGVAAEMDAVRDEVVKYAGSDLLCYRAGEPESLVRDQSAAWDPPLDWMRRRWGARFILAEGVVFAAQTEPALAHVREAVDAAVGDGPDAPLRLAALNVMTTLTGSAILALAVAHGELTAAEAWTAAHVDEDFQIRAWGADAEAEARRARRWLEMQAAALAFG